MFILLENHVITSVQVEVKSFRPDDPILQAFFEQLSAVSVSSRAPCVDLVDALQLKR